MAQIVHGTNDETVAALKAALDAYEAEHSHAEGSLYRQNTASIRVRVIDDDLEGMSRSRRHDHVWEYLRQRVGDEAMQEVSQLLVLVTHELKSSFANMDFDDPLPSRL